LGHGRCRERFLGHESNVFPRAGKEVSKSVRLKLEVCKEEEEEEEAEEEETRHVRLTKQFTICSSSSRNTCPRPRHISDLYVL
jgi:hypothetical protein